MDTNKKIKDWFKTNWVSVLLSVLVAGCLVLAFRQFSFNDNYGKLLNDKYAEQSASFKKQISDIQKVNDERFKQQEELLKVYDKRILLIDAQYKTDLKIISDRQKKSQAKIVVDATRDPSTLTKKITETFGIPNKDAP